MARVSIEQPPPPVRTDRPARAASALLTPKLFRSDPPPQRFFKNLACFLAGLVIIALVIDAQIAQRTRKSNGKRLVGGGDVYPVVHAARHHDDRVRTIFIGDSVARQLFTPGTEPDPQTRYFPSNQAITVAGQYYLLRDALDSFRAARRVYFIYCPTSWANDLSQVWTHDYFCGYFHSPAEVAETFRVTGDVELLAAHAARCAIPNILAFNSTSNAPPPAQQAPPTPPPAANSTSPQFAPHPRLLAPRRRQRSLRFIGPDSQHPRALVISHASEYYLARMKQLCASRGVRLTVLPCPCPRDQWGAFAGEREVYDGAPILYYDRALFRPDGVHFLEPNVPQARRDFILTYHLDAP